jgi:O-antigen ligase
LTVDATRIPIPKVTAVSPARGAMHAGTDGGRSPGDALGLALVAFMALAPLPLGGNRPLFWGLGAAVVALTGLVYAVALWRADRRIRVPLRALPDLALPLALVLGYLLVQVVPLDKVGGRITIATASGEAVASGTVSLDPGSTVLMLLQMAGYGLLGFLAVQVGVRQRRAALVLTAIFWTVVAYAGIGLLSLLELGDTILGVPKWTYLGSATATFVNRNSFATFLAFGVVLGLAVILEILGRPEDRERHRRSGMTEAVLTLCGLVFVIAALLATQSRMGLFAAGCGALLVLAFGAMRAGRARWLAIGVLAALPLIAILVAFYGGGLLERLGSLGEAADVRGALYAQVWQMILANPLLGYGGGSFAMAFPLFHQLPVSPDLVWEKAHSTYLALWSELGLVAGTLPMLIVAFAALRLAMAAGRRTIPGRLALGGLGVIGVAAVHSLADFSLEIQADAQLFVLVLGLAIGAAAGARRDAGAARGEGMSRAQFDASRNG